MASATQIEPADMCRLRRFLALGTETGPYRPASKTPPLLLELATSITHLISLDKGDQVVQEIVRFHESSITANRDALLFALALCARDPDLKTKSTAYDKAFGKVVQNSLDLFTFVDYASKVSKVKEGQGCGWGKAHRKAVSSFYNGQEAKQLCLGLCRYVHRLKWSHRDIIKLAHVKPVNPGVGVVLNFVMKGYYETVQQHGNDEGVAEILQLIKDIHSVKHGEDTHEVARLIEQNKLNVEFVPTTLLKSNEIWLALSRGMTLRELIGWLGRMTSVGVFGANSALEQIQCRIVDNNAIKTEKLHPIEILIAMKEYEHNKFQKTWQKKKPVVTAATEATPTDGKAKYTPSPQILGSLKKAFYLSFKHIPSGSKRCLVALDVRAPPGRTMGACHVTPSLAASVLAMTVVRSHKQTTTVVYDSGITPVKVTPDMDLDLVAKTIKRTNSGSTDCSLPVMWATERSDKYDVIMVVTDKPACVSRQPAMAIRQYREVLGMPHTRMVTVFLTCDRVLVAPPDDPLMIDMIGLDAGTPKILHSFLQCLL